MVLATSLQNMQLKVISAIKVYFFLHNKASQRRFQNWPGNSGSASLRSSVFSFWFQQGYNSSRHYVLIGECLKADERRWSLPDRSVSSEWEKSVPEAPTDPWNILALPWNIGAILSCRRCWKVSIWYLQSLRQDTDAASRKGNWVWLPCRQPAPSVCDKSDER